MHLKFSVLINLKLIDLDRVFKKQLKNLLKHFSITSNATINFLQT